MAAFKIFSMFEVGIRKLEYFKVKRQINVLKM